jgi:diaminohydroxyphosphoribosylaminopyrimidine deaminase / 5-amino-6-(5-phosphoribosylamino)uracil reductase
VIVAADAYYMRKAIALAERGRGRTNPNPMVGALVVDSDGVIVGRGAHQVAGGPHAEVIALEEAGVRARGATLYCTLEPCSHTGRTGPCAPLVANAGIQRAVIAVEDPNPLVQGGGLAVLRGRGLDVVVGVLRASAEAQNEAFLATMRQPRPFVILKVALSADGCLAGAGGQRVDLTGPAANRAIQRQRAEVDAIVIGSSTLLADDPLLTPRGAYRARPLARVILDRRLRATPVARIFTTLEAGPVIIMSTEVLCAEHREQVRRLERAGARVVALPSGDLHEALAWLKAEGMIAVVLEGGAAVHRAALSAGVVDVVNAYITPRVLGPRGLKWMGATHFTFAELHRRRATWLGDDVRVEGHVYRTD